MVERACILPPGSRIGPLTPAERAPVLQGSVLRGHYEHARRSRIGLRKTEGEGGGYAGYVGYARYAGYAGYAGYEVRR